MSALVLTGAGVGTADVAAVAREARKVEVRSDVLGRLQKARTVLDQAAASGQQIYGLNTGLGANLGTTVEGDASAFQRQLLEGRSGAVGEALPVETVRATMFARAATLSTGGSGLSPTRTDECLLTFRRVIIMLSIRRAPDPSPAPKSLGTMSAPKDLRSV